ncbi:MAG: cation:dicarboxylase symporter family transporter, partial [Bacteroidetes bacterium]|nr:cation:dicarboxylase symporter family transporter [Bacteroidota bacterium]
MESTGKNKWWHLSLTKQILIGLIVGVLIGWLAPEFSKETAFLRTIFLNLIKVIIAPLIFGSIVAGIAGGGSAKKVGRIGWKALVYFELVTTMALMIGLIVVNITGPGYGVELKGDTVNLGQIAENHPMTFVQTLVHAFPSNIIDSMMRNDVLQIVVFSVIFAFAVSAMGKKGEPILQLADSLSQVMFKFTSYI